MEQRSPAPNIAEAESSRGYAAAISAYLIWGLVVPLYFKSLSHVPTAEIVAHRIAWAVPFVAILLAWRGRLAGMRAFLTPTYLGLAALTASVITLNWGTYVYAVINGQAVEAALGYYINPLVSILLGAAFLGERPTRLQCVAIVLAAIGVLVMTVMAGGLPIVSLILALSFGSYGLLRKLIPIGAAEGFFLEVLILLLPALAVCIWLVAHGEAQFGTSTGETLLLIGSGPTTAIPLILFAAGARMLKLSTIGILQYMVPTLLVLTAVYLFGEPFGPWRLVAFAFIWVALAIYTWSLVADGRRRRRTRKADAVPGC
ncbi:EamA family transporter RarD [Aureimonas sp. OT7]|uniref:EamA family transporter RarD n=1 Tax=Aureimonas sp. OT7 TaxID=2816454 RepID=UPI0017812D90|nr:EamA family transporter RarD [Aureimonas sp. OT7]QOG05951.1 EamA family transporter RarD [Aureimonas sp. OT7]